MDIKKMNSILKTLFPMSRDPPKKGNRKKTNRDIPNITREELEIIVKNSNKKRKVTPDVDGVSKRIIMIAIRTCPDMFIYLYNKCLETGCFPRRWKVTRLILLRKPGKTDDSPAAFRPLCLINEIAKIFEKIIKNRIESHMKQSGNNLSHRQYGFIEGKSTVDAILKFREISEKKEDLGKLTLAISIDIANAFNSIEWKKIMRSLKFKKLPEYITNIIRNYLNQRVVIWIGSGGKIYSRNMERGVPQGSILGPLLWNMAYDLVLRMPLHKSCEMLCYADDTLILVDGYNVNEVRFMANLMLAILNKKLKYL